MRLDDLLNKEYQATQSASQTIELLTGTYEKLLEVHQVTESLIALLPSIKMFIQLTHRIVGAFMPGISRSLKAT
jgi:hypothetical protein